MNQREYLQSDFDPKALKVSQLRSILLEQNVDYSAAKKKSELVRLFNTHVKGKGHHEKSKESKKHHSRDESKSRSRSRSPVKHNNENDEPTKSKKSKKKSLFVEEDKPAAAPALQKESPNVFQGKDQEKLVPQKRERTDESDIKSAEPQKERKIKLARKSKPKLDVNDYASQESSSEEYTKLDHEIRLNRTPLKLDRSVSETSDQRRNEEMKTPSKTLFSLEDEIKFSPSSRETFKEQSKDSHLPKRDFSSPISSYVSPMAEKKNTSIIEASPKLFSVEDDIDKFEEAQKKLDKDLETEEGETHQEVEKLQVEKLQETKVAVPVSWKQIFGTFFFSLLLLIVSVAFSWYRAQRINIGYCGNEIDEKFFVCDPETIPSFVAEKIEALDDVLMSYRPKCVPCPKHAECLPEFELKCLPDYVATKNGVDVFGLVPRAKNCVPDTKKAERIAKMTEFSLDTLRRRNAMVKCGDGSEEVAGFSVKELHDLLHELKAEWMADSEFEYYWSKTLKDLETEPEITVRHVSTSRSTNKQLCEPGNNGVTQVPSHHQTADKNKNTIIRSTSYSKLDFKCRLEKNLVRALLKYKAGIIGSLLLVFTFRFYRSHSTRARKREHKVAKLVSDVLDRLQAQARSSKADSTDKTKPFIGSIQLRDLLLNEENAKIKNTIWERVAKRVELNSNVSRDVLEVHGEIMKVWEWVTDLAK